MAIMCQGCGAELITWTGSCPHCGAGAMMDVRKREDPILGKLIAGKYKVTKKLGQGGMGAVYLAEHTGVGQRVAIKFLNPVFSGDPDVVRRFLNEAKSYGQISHHHAVQLHDFGQDDEGNLFISMEFIEGVDLKRTLEKERRLRLKDAFDIALQICDVLGYAHGKGIVHRDLKPENVMLSKGLRGYHAKVLDFGVARLMAEQGTRLTAVGSICGTPRYMSPEQAEGGDVDHRTDIYSLGLVLFECVTGVHPFAAGTIAETMRRQVTMPMPKIADVAPELKVPDALDAVIQKAVAKKREDRYVSMSDIAKSLVDAMPTDASLAAYDAKTDVGLGDAQTLQKRAGALEKTGYPASPFTAPREKTSAKLKIGVGVGAGVLVLGALAVFAVGPGKSRPAEVWEEMAKEEPKTAAPAAAPAPAPSAPAPEIVTAAPTPAAEPVPAPAPASATAPANPAGAPGGKPAAAGNSSSRPRPSAAPAAGGIDEMRRVADRAVAQMDENLVVSAKQEYAAGNLGIALDKLKQIPAHSTARASADALEEKVVRTKALLEKAHAACDGGRFEEGLNLYNEALKLNDGLREAKDGKKKCETARRPGTIDP